MTRNISIRSTRLLFLILFFILFAAVGSARVVTLQFADTSFAEMFQTIGEVADLNVVVDSSVQGSGSIKLTDISVADALEYVSSLSGYPHRIVGSTLLVASSERMKKFETSSLRYVEYQFADATAISSALDLIMDLQDVYIYEDNRLVILRGTPEELDRAEEVLRKIDRPSKVTIDSSQKSILAVLEEIASALHLNLIADPELENRFLSVQFRNEDPKAILAQLSKNADLDITVEEETLVATIAKEQPEKEVRERVKVYRLNFVSPELAKSAIEMVVPANKVVADKTSIMVRGSEEVLEEIDVLIADLDFAPRQVLIEAWVQEISTDELRTVGIEWQGTPSFEGLDAPTFLELEWKPWELFLALKALEEQDKSKLLARPQIATIDGEEASIFIGDRVPVRVQTGEDSEEIIYFESGITLRITPRISADGFITTKISPEVSTFVQSDTDLPRTRTREAETTVRVKDGQPIVIGGLIQEQFNETVTGIPIVSKLPILGRLFQWTDKDSTQAEMVIFMVPRIIDGTEGVPTSDMFAPRNSEENE